MECQHYYKGASALHFGKNELHAHPGLASAIVGENLDPEKQKMFTIGQSLAYPPASVRRFKQVLHC